MYTRIDPATENRSSQHALESESLRAPLNPHSEAATQLQSMANESLQVNRLLTYQRMANAHSEKQEVTQLQHLANDSNTVMQLKSIQGGGYLTGTVKYTKQSNNGNDSAYAMEAKNLTLKDQNVTVTRRRSQSFGRPTGLDRPSNIGINKRETSLQTNAPAQW